MIWDYKFLTFTCIDISIDLFYEEISQLLSSISRFPDNWNVGKAELQFKDIYHPTPKPGGSHLTRFIAWEPISKPGSVVFFVNYADGWNSLIELYAKKYKRTCIHVGLSDDGLDYPMYKFYFYSGIERRTVLSFRDEKGWNFYQKGEMQPFEIAEIYNKRRIIERLPNRIICKYLSVFDWNIEDNNFWRTSQPVYRFERLKWD